MSSFEEDLEEMRKILDDLESSELTLEEMIEKYRIGVELAKKCKKILMKPKRKLKKYLVSLMEYEILDKINDPADLRALNKKELVKLSKELRHFLIDSVSKTGGHLAAGLGAIEITIALHKVFNTPSDKLVWDIGHQCYPHKILTEGNI